MNDTELLKGIIDEILGEPTKTNYDTNQIAYDCPTCSHDIKGLDHLDGKGNLEVNLSRHIFRCWACDESHGTHGPLGKLIDMFGTKKDKEMYDLIRPDEIKAKEKKYDKLRLPNNFKRFSEVNSRYPPRREAYNYLKRRGVTDSIIEKYDIGFVLGGEYSGRIIVPSYDKKGNLNYFVGRSWNKFAKLKYKNPVAPKEDIIFNESRLNWKKDIWLVEGVFDSFFVDNSIPLLGKTLTDNLWNKLYDKAKANIIVCLDLEAWENAKKIYFNLSGGKLYGRVKIIKLPDDKDLGDLRGVISDECYIDLEK